MLILFLINSNLVIMSSSWFEYLHILLWQHHILRRDFYIRSIIKANDSLD